MQGFRRRFLKISGYVLGFLVVAGVAFHFWFKAHARQLIEDLVESRSNGKLKLQVDKFRFNWFSKKMEFHNAVFYSTDTINANTAYQFTVDRIRLKLDAILPIVFNKRIIIDTLTLHQPHITVTRLKKNEVGDSLARRDVSIPEEMGNIYNSIQEGLKVLRVSKFMIDDGTFTLVNRIDPEQRPVSIGNLFFQIDNLAVDTTIEGARDKILFSDNVVLKSHHQDILFPDSRHRLQFANFQINLQQKLVAFDSCTISAARTDSAAAEFSMYMDALKLIDIDFDTLYKTEVIKADSVYCVNPRFNLNVVTDDKTGSGAPVPKLENIIKQLTGDLVLNYVVVTEADFYITTVKNGVPNTFEFTDNNFEMQGLKIDRELESPIRVKSFAMAIRNYENFIRDSTYSVQFDSVLFRDDRIYLSNFVFHKFDERRRIVNTFNIPQFYLSGLSWDALVFDRKLKADQATLFYPRIQYTVSDKLRQKPGGQDVFESIASINEVMDLLYLDIVDGNIDVKINNDVRIQLSEATLSIESHDLLQSRQLAGIKNSLTALDFRHGTIRAGNLELTLKDIHYVGETGHFNAGRVVVKEKDQKLFLDLEEVLVDKMLVDEKKGDIFSENIRWKKGKVHIRSTPGGEGPRSVFDIRNATGYNTELIADIGTARMRSFVREMHVDRVDKVPGKKANIHGLRAEGNNLRWSQEGRNLSIDFYNFFDQRASRIDRVTYRHEEGMRRSRIDIASVTFIPFLQTLIGGEPVLSDVHLVEPVLDLVADSTTGGTATFPRLSIDRLIAQAPTVFFRKKSSKGELSLQWDGEAQGEVLKLTGIDSRKDNGLSVDQVETRLSAFRLQLPGGRKFGTGDGKIITTVKDLRLGAETGWAANLEQLEAENIQVDSLGRKKNKLDITHLFLQQLGLSRSSVTNLATLTHANRSFAVSDFHGSLEGSETSLHWFGLAMSRPGQFFRLDSLRWAPRESRDSFLARQAYQKDYMVIQSGPIVLQNADIEDFIRDKTVSGKTLSISKPVIEITRDTKLPVDRSRTKPMPTTILSNLASPVKIDEILLRDAAVLYTEIGEVGPVTIPIEQLNASITNVRNENTGPADSLYLDAQAMIFDTARVELRLQQSYHDTLNGFRMQARFGPLDLRTLNQAFVPLGSVYIQSGKLDSAHLTATGHEYFAYGEMKMDFEDLKIKLLKSPGSTDPSNVKKLLSFIANTFVIRNRDRQKPAILFVERSRDRSIFNYLVKIATKGFQVSIGVSSNRKQEKEYRKRLN